MRRIISFPLPGSLIAGLILQILFLAACPLSARMRIIIDTDAACERDDQYAITYALLSPEYFEIEGFTAVHNGPGTLEENFLEIHNILGLAGVGGIPVYRGAAGPMSSAGEPVQSDAVRFIIERSKVMDRGKLLVLGIGAATNLASAVLLDPLIKKRVTFAWLGGTDWPDGAGGEHNSLQDPAAQRVLFTSGVKLKYIPRGNNAMFQSKYHSGRALRGVSPLGDYLHLLMMTNKYPMDKTFNIAGLAAVCALAHPERANWLHSPAPWINNRGGCDWSRTFGEISIATSLLEDVYGAPVPLWDEFYRKVAEAAPGEPASVREELCKVLNIHPDPPGVAPVEGEVEERDGFLRQEVCWPTILGEHVPAYLCKPLNAGGKKLPAVICLSGTGGDRIVLTTDFFGRADYVSLGRPPGQQRTRHRLQGWAAEIARRGYITLSITQRGLGDRGFQQDKQSKSALIRGFTAQGLHVHEIRQALSYLSLRPDVDPNRIACTGLSYGGITTFYATAADTRFKAAAPVCGGVGSLRHMLEIGSTGYHGHYWWVPRILLHFDQGELIAAQAPRPYFIAAPLDDIGMPKEGVQELQDKAKPAYRRAGAADALVVFRPPGPHKFTAEIFEELIKFFDKYL
ncbi:MAG: nucleoside hydrolase [Gemmatimonadota bacterium]|nr:nucleoside hydrolase [Gemmatimonadota bacterium]